MRNDVILGISIDVGEILSVLIDGRSGELLAQNRIPVWANTDLVGTIDNLIRSAPEPIDSVGIACVDPATQVALSNQIRRRDDEDDDAVPPWLLAATITSAALALAVFASRQFAGLGKVLVVNLDSAGHTGAIQPLVLVDPATQSVVDTATLPAFTPPVQDSAGAHAVADSMTRLPGRGRDIEMVTSAGAGSGRPDVAASLGAATGIPVEPLDHGEFAIAHGAAALTQQNHGAVAAAAAGPGRKRALLLGAAGVAVSAALIGGSAFLIKGGSDGPANADFVAPISTTATPSTFTKTTSKSFTPLVRPPSSSATSTSTTTTTTDTPVTTTPEPVTPQPTPVRVPGNTPRPPTSERADVPDWTPPTRPSVPTRPTTPSTPSSPSSPQQPPADDVPR